MRWAREMLRLSLQPGSVCCGRRSHAMHAGALTPLQPRSGAGNIFVRAFGTRGAEDCAASAKNETEYEAVIGLECHVQLKTASKAFCPCPNEYGAAPNTHVCPICLGHPGTLPSLNRAAVEKALSVALALDCEVSPQSHFDRKQYFYADLSKGYQITQQRAPLAVNGRLHLPAAAVKPRGANKEGKAAVLLRSSAPPSTSRSIGIERMHLEEDAARTQYVGSQALRGATSALLDFNRAGVPLLEIVTRPDLRSAAEAAAAGAELRRILRALGASSASMARGAMRVDVNVSVRRRGSRRLGAKVEVKNVNSLLAVQRAIEFEVARQTALLQSGSAGAAHVAAETRSWDEQREQTFAMRSKEGAADYRYLPEPDLPGLRLAPEELRAAREALPELPAQQRARLEAAGVALAEALLLSDDRAAGGLVDGLVEEGVPHRRAAAWVLGDVLAWCKEKHVVLRDASLPVAALAELLCLVEDGIISGKIAKELLPLVLDGRLRGSIRDEVEKRGLVQMRDSEGLANMVEQVLQDNATQLQQYLQGKKKLKGFFAGQVMKLSNGLAHPKELDAILSRRLLERESN